MTAYQNSTCQILIREPKSPYCSDPMASGWYWATNHPETSCTGSHKKNTKIGTSTHTHTHRAIHVSKISSRNSTKYLVPHSKSATSDFTKIIPSRCLPRHLDVPKYGQVKSQVGLVSLSMAAYCS